MGGFLSRVTPPEWLYGYDDGFNDNPTQEVVGEGLKQSVYDDGYEAGKQDREEVNREHSSNA